VIAPAILPERTGVYGYIALPSALEARTPSLGDDCPSLNHAGLTTWVRDSFSYSSGLELDSIISEHYSRAAPLGDAPGEAQQVERTYWTDEYGLSRWEKWARDDWVNPHNHLTALQQAQALFRSGDCKAPYSINAKVSANLMYRPEVLTDTFGRLIQQSGEPNAHTWYLTLCEDYTKIVKTPQGARSTWEDGLQDVYWVN
jgi:hypothetical protein